MRKSDVLGIIKEIAEPTWAQAKPGDTSYPDNTPDGSMEKSAAATLTVTDEPDVEHPFNEATVNQIEKAERALKDVEKEMKSVLADYKAAEGDDKKPFVEKLKELTAKKKEAEKHLNKVKDEFESQAAPEEDIVAETITEELTRTDKSDIKKMIAKEIEATLKSKNFKDKVSDEVSKDVKKNKELEKVVVEITRNVVTQLYKVLWMRRTFWRNSLKNVPA
tara:strand:+ start:470 stop:1129 length:660 start_codon:yes stop_codon:yes gene_type:complete